ncbi:MAG TPA: CopG family transcriptional regulator [Rhodanobacter sp.]
MTTTTIRLPDALKSRVAAAAKRMGTTTHGFILEAIAEKAELAERRAGFDAEAEQRYARIAASGETISWETMRRYLEGKAAGKTVRRPAPRKLAK